MYRTWQAHESTIVRSTYVVRSKRSCESQTRLVRRMIDLALTLPRMAFGASVRMRLPYQDGQTVSWLSFVQYCGQTAKKPSLRKLMVGRWVMTVFFGRIRLAQFSEDTAC